VITSVNNDVVSWPSYSSQVRVDNYTAIWSSPWLPTAPICVVSDTTWRCLRQSSTDGLWHNNKAIVSSFTPLKRISTDSIMAVALARDGTVYEWNPVGVVNTTVNPTDRFIDLCRMQHCTCGTFVIQSYHHHQRPSTHGGVFVCEHIGIRTNGTIVCWCDSRPSEPVDDGRDSPQSVLHYTTALHYRCELSSTFGVNQSFAYLYREAPASMIFLVLNVQHNHHALSDPMAMCIAGSHIPMRILLSNCMCLNTVNK
jgi:hypothetical protein